MRVKITPDDKGKPHGKLADCELEFSNGPLEGLKLISEQREAWPCQFSIKESRVGRFALTRLETLSGDTAERHMRKRGVRTYSLRYAGR